MTKLLISLGIQRQQPLQHQQLSHNTNIHLLKICDDDVDHDDEVNLEYYYLAYALWCPLQMRD